MNLSVVIHARDTVPLNLREVLNGEGVVVADNPWTTHLHGQPTHRVVLTAATRPCTNFLAHAWAVTTQRPNDPICLLPHGDCFRQAHKQRKSWVSSTDGARMDAMILPQALIDKWVAWSAWAVARQVPDEESLVAYLWSYGVRTLHPIPSLVRPRTDDAIWMASARETWQAGEPILLDESHRDAGPDVLLGRLLQDGLKAHYDYVARRWTCEAAAAFAP